ncbi:type I polyketide synthase [Variovorax sp. PAMC 28711]|uniref:type I polyketide synthase n=1 Tax=Variovorax sp. PAMC 28711 TaxID=1795631 RepID=UPI00078D4736|nr:type I polyketide synthase [Variovorax sp. PAMC 28711]AMM24058.1 thioester reductase [Variovorax sp. PAMC 28711]
MTLRPPALASPLSLLDLLSPAASTPCAAGIRLNEQLALDVGWVAASRGQIAAEGWQAATPWVAAFLWLQQSWFGNGPLVPRGLCRDWLSQVDAARRNGELPDTAIGWGGTTPEADRDPLALWLGVDASHAWLSGPADRLDAESARQLLAILSATTANLLLDLAAPVDSIPGVLPDERRRMCETWNRPIPQRDASLTVHGRFAEQAALHSARPALTGIAGEAGTAAWRYAELDARADRMARQLQALGVMPGDAVGVMLERSPMAVVALLGILKTGAAYVPVQANFPADRLKFMLGDAGVTLVVSQRLHADALPGEMAALWIDDAPPDARALPPLKSVTVDSEARAYVMYTSGSTGTPKGIEICHRSILRLVLDAAYVDLRSDEPVLHAAPLGFDASTLEIWGPLLNGGCCVVHDEHMPTGAGLARTIERHGVKTAWLTAALFNAVVDDDAQHLAGLRQLLTGGEALSVAHVRRALAALPGLTLINGYGPTECTTFAATYRIPRDLPASARSVPIGRPLTDTTLHVLSPTLQLLPIGLVGELCIGGRGLARGYLRQPELTAERFVPDPFGRPGDRLYRTGDHARWLPDGTIDFIGRVDGQVKIRGHRIETGEIESVLNAHPGILTSAVVARTDHGEAPRLVAYLVARDKPVPWNDLRAHIAASLPDVMVPAAQVWLDALPITLNGKLDRRALPEPTRARPEMAEDFEAARDPLEVRVCQAFAGALGLDRIGRRDNFFDLGGNSLLVLKVLTQLQQGMSHTLSANLFFSDPTPMAIAAEMAGPQEATPPRASPTRSDRNAEEAIAVIGMAGRFPGAADLEQFWDNLVAGRDTISVFTDATLDASVSAALRSNPAYVRARGVLEDVDLFDAAFFGINPKEAELMDPQHRIFLELCWECMERAGHAPDRCTEPVGIYAGMYNATYFQRHVSSRPDLVEAVGEFQVMLANEKDYIATRVANKLNLTGPAVSVHTACSTSLVAIAQAFYALRTRQCDMALAGGASVTCPPRSGYLYEEGSMLSPDGKTRSFSAGAQGTVFSDGAAVVLLKRLSDAVADGDTVYAVLRGAAINNDGGAKASFTAPSIKGQAAVVSAALASAGVDARSISYVEAHGTATPMGDPVEIEGLRQAYARHTSDLGFCAIGSLKSNVGHMVTAAGAGGLIKTVLALHNETLPPSLHFDAPNPSIDFAATPFHVQHSLAAWPRSVQPRRAGVSAFGVGGTNAHVIVEEAPPALPPEHSALPQLLQLSARTPAALSAAVQRLADHLEAHPQLELADVAHTLRVGRKVFSNRACVVAGDAAQAVAALRSTDSPQRASGGAAAFQPQPVLLFTGQGAQYARMGQGLYEGDTVFRAAFDDCLRAFDGVLDFDLRACLQSSDPLALAPTSVTQPATFALEYALARQLLSLGLVPVALIGHSVGEFAAAVVAGVMRLDDAARLVAHRGLLMQAQPAGDMLAVRLPAADVLARLPDTLSLAAENGPKACVVAGPSADVEALRVVLDAEGVTTRRLQTSHAFHSAMMDAAVAPFEQRVRAVRLSPPAIPIYSTLTGRLLTPDEATDPRYWSRHLRETVRFSPAVRAALADVPHALFIEVGPRNTLTTLVRQQPSGATPIRAVALLTDQPDGECAAWRLAVGRLWIDGVAIDPAKLDARTRKSRLSLPTYPFERKRFWVDVAAPATPPLSLPLIPEPPMTAAMPHASTAPARHAALSSRLRAIFEDISGVDMAQADGAVLFVELGLDSLTLTQAAGQVKKHFKVNLSFRQLMESYRTFDSLAGFLDATLPPEAAPVAVAVAMPAAVPAAAQAVVAPRSMALAMPQFMPTASIDGQPLMHQLIAQQMQLMQQQLALLAGVPAVATSAESPVAMAAPALAAEPVQVPTTDSEPTDAPVRITYDVKKAFGAIARIHTQSKEPSERQRARLAAFMRRYNERTQKSKTFTEVNRPHMADPRVVNGFRPATKEITYQVVVERSKGSRLWDIDGNEYVDVLNGFGMNLFGWQPDFVNEAVHRQLDLGYEIGPQHPLSAEVTQLICELTGFDRAALCNTGSESVMAAIRIARTVTGRNTVVLFAGSYHGTFDEVLVRAGRNAKGLSAAPGVLQGMFGDVRVLDYGTPEALEFIRANANDIAAVLVEPVQSRRPDFQPREFLREVRAITEKSDTCLIFDEVITGFRSHLGGAQAVYGIRADLACYGKVIGGGFPVGVVAGKREYMDALDGGAWQYGDSSMPTVGVTYFAGTFVRHPLALAACKASLIHLKEAGEGLQTQLNLHTAALADELTAFCREVGAPLEIRYFSSLWRVSWLEDHPLQDLLFAMMRSRGVHILDNFPCFLTTAHTHDDIATIKSAFKESVAEMQQSEFLPGSAPSARSFDAAHPPVPNARLGRDRDGTPAWFVPDPTANGKFVKLQA